MKKMFAVLIALAILGFVACNEKQSITNPQNNQTVLNAGDKSNGILDNPTGTPKDTTKKDTTNIGKKILPPDSSKWGKKPPPPPPPPPDTSKLGKKWPPPPPPPDTSKLGKKIPPPPPPPPDTSKLGKKKPPPPPPPPDTSKLGKKKPPTPIDTGKFKKVPPPPPGPLGQIFQKMGLTKDQMTQISTLNKSNDDCMKAAMQILRDAEKAILDNANVQRQAILQQVKDGTLSKADAKTQLDALNQQTKDLLLNDPAKLASCEAAKLCREQYYAAIRALLTPEQQVIWDAWVAAQPVIDCTKATSPTKP